MTILSRKIGEALGVFAGRMPKGKTKKRIELTSMDYYYDYCRIIANLDGAEECCCAFNGLASVAISGQEFVKNHLRMSDIMSNHATKQSPTRKIGETLNVFAGRVTIAAVGAGISLAIYHGWVI